MTNGSFLSNMWRMYSVLYRDYKIKYKIKINTPPTTKKLLHLLNDKYYLDYLIYSYYKQYLDLIIKNTICLNI